jgi:hypothetical protein
MIQLDLTEHECDVLARALERYVSDLRIEIADTERIAWRDTLKQQVAALNKVLETLRSQSHATHEPEI